MSKAYRFLMSALAVVMIGAPTVASAAENDPMACTVDVKYFQNNTLRLTYTKEFQVAVDAPYTDDFSTATRFRFFDSRLSYENGIPVVWISWDADVNVFNAVAFQATLKVTDETHGETTTGRSGFFGSSVGSNATDYTLTCKRAD